MAGKAEQLWEVIGGADKGGILVRSGRTASSSPFSDRLSCGAIVAELEQVDGRLHYELVSGTGPASGWVALRVSGKDLLQKTNQIALDTEKIEVGDVCEVIGGVEKGGIIARRGKEGWSQIRGTLSCGARISIKAHEEDRLLYELMEGSGPASAWIDSDCDGKPLLAIVTKAVITKVDNSELDTEVGTSDAGESDDAHTTDVDTQSVTSIAADCSIENPIQQKHPDADGIAKDLLKEYASRLKQASQKMFGLDTLVVRPKKVQQHLPLSNGERAELESDLQNTDLLTGAFQNTRQLTTKNWVDLNGETVRLCGRCMLPLGSSAYIGSGKDIFLHSECLAQSMLEQLRHEENKLSKNHKLKKMQQRMEFDIGWRIERIPRNASAFEKLQVRDAPKGMVCIVYDDESNSIQLAPTLEPAAAINMEYLSLALRAQHSDGCEPWFSLNAVDPSNKDSMLKKTYHPDWLKNTSMGEVLFQADYHLKELSMGECDQPVVGMKSSFDWSSKEGHDDRWVGREWFVLNKAEIKLSDDNVVIPQFKMGIQAREMFLNSDGKLEDRPITRRTHPLVKYAEQFTHYFDLIAERKSAIFQLREVAKATIAAKFLMDSKVNLDGDMFNLADDVESDIIDEIPRLWNMRGESQIEIKDGMLVAEGDSGLDINSVYGGVQLSIGRVLAPSKPTIAAMQLALAKPPPTLKEFKPVAGVSVRAIARKEEFIRPMGTADVDKPSGFKTILYEGFQVRTATVDARRAREITAEKAKAQGVDLNLSKFDLSPVKRTSEICAAPADAIEAKASIGHVFLESLNDSCESIYQDWQKEVFKDIYNPSLCDRVIEGDLFIPPNTSGEYMKTIQSLLLSEKELHHMRKSHFKAANFKMSDPGMGFPTSWTSSFAIANGAAVVRAAGGDLQPGVLQARPDFLKDPTLLQRMRSCSSLIFDKSTEDGSVFRIYRVGSIEVRSVEEHGSSEVVLAVFAIRPAMLDSAACKTIRDDEKLAKVTMYVEVAPCVSAPMSMPYQQYYTVLDTVLGNTIVTEQFQDGTTSWQVNPSDLVKRNSLAKTFCSEACDSFNTTVMDVKVYQMTGFSERCTSGKHYAQGVFNKAVAKDGHDNAFFKPPSQNQAPTKQFPGF